MKRPTYEEVKSAIETGVENGYELGDCSPAELAADLMAYEETLQDANPGLVLAYAGKWLEEKRKS